MKVLVPVTQYVEMDFCEAIKKYEFDWRFACLYSGDMEGYLGEKDDVVIEILADVPDEYGELDEKVIAFVNLGEHHPFYTKISLEKFMLKNPDRIIDYSKIEDLVSYHY